MHLVNKCYLVHENKHNATLDYIIYIYRHISKPIPLHNFFYMCDLGGLYLTDMSNMIHEYRKLSKEVRTFYKIEISGIEKKLSHFKCFF